MLIFKGYKVKNLEEDVEVNEITLRYNSKDVVLQKGETLDVRDFDVPNGGVVNVEKHIIKKNAGKGLEISFNKTGSKDGIESLKEIKALEGNVSDLNKQVKELQNANEELTQKHAAMAGEVETAKQESQSLRKDMPRIVKENEELKEEVQKLRLRVGTNKKDK